jgi:hypothetical protein
MKIKIEGDTWFLHMEIEFDTDGTIVRGVLKRDASAWRLHIEGADLDTSMWVGTRKIETGKAIERALPMLERYAASVSAASRSKT